MNIYKAIEHCVSGLPDSGYHSDNPLNTAVKDVKALVAAYNALAPTPEMWADAPEWAQWFCIELGAMEKNDFSWWWADEPILNCKDWTPSIVLEGGFSASHFAGYVHLPLGIDWRLCKWQRPEVTR